MAAAIFSAESLANKFSDDEVRLNCAKKTAFRGIFGEDGALEFKSLLLRQRVSGLRHSPGKCANCTRLGAMRPPHRTVQCLDDDYRNLEVLRSPEY